MRRLAAIVLPVVIGFPFRPDHIDLSSWRSLLAILYSVPEIISSSFSVILARIIIMVSNILSFIAQYIVLPLGLFRYRHLWFEYPSISRLPLFGAILPSETSSSATLAEMPGR